MADILWGISICEKERVELAEFLKEKSNLDKHNLD